MLRRDLHRRKKHYLLPRCSPKCMRLDISRQIERKSKINVRAQLQASQYGAGILPHVAILQSYKYPILFTLSRFIIFHISTLIVEKQQQRAVRYDYQKKNIDMLARFITSVAFILSSLESIAAVSSTNGVDVFERSPDALGLLLFPHTKRTGLGLESRGIGRRALHPRKEVVLSYGQGRSLRRLLIFLLPNL